MIDAVANELCVDTELSLLASEFFAAVLRVFDAGDDELEAVGVRPPVVRHVLEGDKVAASEQCPDLLLCIATREIRLGRRSVVSAIIHIEVVVAVQLQQVEVQHKPLQYRVRLERDGAVEVPLIPRPDHASVQLSILTLEKVILAQ